MHGEFRTDIAVTLNNLGVLDCMYGQYAQAEPLLTRALAINKKLLGFDYPDVALSVVSLSSFAWFRAAGESGTAVPSSLGDSQAGALGRPIQRSRRRWKNLANALRKLGHADEGVSLELRAKNFRAKRS